MDQAAQRLNRVIATTAAGSSCAGAKQLEVPGVVRFAVSPDDAVPLHIALSSPDVAISPNGEHIAYLTETIGLGAERTPLFACTRGGQRDELPGVLQPVDDLARLERLTGDRLDETALDAAPDGADQRHHRLVHQDAEGRDVPCQRVVG